MEIFGLEIRRARKPEPISRKAVEALEVYKNLEVRSYEKGFTRAGQETRRYFSRERKKDNDDTAFQMDLRNTYASFSIPKGRLIHIFEWGHIPKHDEGENLVCMITNPSGELINVNNSLKAYDELLIENGRIKISGLDWNLPPIDKRSLEPYAELASLIRSDVRKQFSI